MTLSNSLIVPHTLLVYQALLSRKTASPQERHYYHRLRKGFIGEKRLEKLVQSANSNKTIALFDCLFEQDGREFQIDCLLITADIIFLLEVKNYSGDYYIEHNKLFNFETRQEVYNPTTQLERTEYFFNRLLDELRINITVRPYVIFINPEFMLYKATSRLPMIFTPQVKRFLQKVNANASVPTNNTKRIVTLLNKRQKDKSTYERLPECNLSQLKRGLFCKRCFAKLVRKNQYTLLCSTCQSHYRLEEAILFAIAQYHLLFPQNKITIAKIQDWCGDSLSKNPIRRVLANNLNVQLNSSHTYYKFADQTSHLELLSKNYINNLKN